MKAFVINVVGDIGLTLGAFFILQSSHTLDFLGTFEQAKEIGDAILESFLRDASDGGVDEIHPAPQAVADEGPGPRAIVRARDGALTLTTMRFHDEVRSANDVPSAAGKRTKPSKQELDTAVALIKALAEDWDPTAHQDRHRKRLQKIVRDKRKGKTIEIPDDATSEPGPPPDLMAALKEAIAAATK